MKISAKLMWLGLAWLILIIIVAVFAISGVSMMHLSCDVLQHLGQPVYLGLLSNVGILAWCVAGCICLFSACLIKTNAKNDATGGFLVWLGILSLLLMADDLLMIHEVLLPKYLHLSDISLYGIYFVYVSIFFLKYWKFILQRTDYGFMALAFFLLGSSVAIDIDVFPGGIDVEDSFKLLGIITYAQYCIMSSADLIRKAIRTSPLVK